MRRGWSHWAVAVAASLLVCAVEVRGQPDLEVQVECPWAGHYKIDTWFPLRVLAENRGDARRGVVTVGLPVRNGEGSFELPLNLPRNSRQAHYLYVRTDTFAGQVEPRLAAGRLRRRLKAQPLRAHYESDAIILLIGRQAAGLSFLTQLNLPVPATAPGGAYGVPGGGWGASGPQPEVVVCYYDVQQGKGLPGLGLPGHWAGYDSLDLIVLRDVSPREFSQEEREALKAWVARGGELVVVPGANVSEVRQSFLEEMLPVRLTGSDVVPAATALARHYGEPLPAGAQGMMPVATSRLRKGAVAVISVGATPLLARCRYGAGTIYLFAFDFLRDPLRGWDDLQLKLWRDILTARRKTPQPSRTAAYGPMGSPNDPSSMVASLTQLELPSLWLVGGFLLLYLICLVPANYFVLKRLDRRELAWVTTPAIVVVFSVGAYVVGHSMKGGDLVVTEVRVVRGPAGARQVCSRGYLGVYSPRSAEYALTAGSRQATLSEAALAETSSVATIRQGETFEIPRAPINMWSMRTFEYDDVCDLGGSVEAVATYGRGKLDVEVTNGTAYDLRDCFLVRGGQVEWLGNQGKGEHARAALSGQVAAGAGGGVAQQAIARSGLSRRPDQLNAEERLRKSALEHLFGQGSEAYVEGSGADVLFVGWADTKPLEVKLRPGRERRVRATLVLADIYASGAPGAGAFEAACGLKRMAIVKVQMDTGYGWEAYGPGATPRLRISKGTMELEAPLPAAAGASSLDSLEVGLGCDRGRLELGVWNVKSRQWETHFSGDVTNRSVKVLLASAEEYVGPRDGLVKLRLVKKDERDTHLSRLQVKVRGRQ